MESKEQLAVTEGELVMLRLSTRFGYSNTWWRVMFIDTDGTFIGKLERCHWHEYEAHKIGDHERFDCEDVKHTHKEGEQFCYSDNITICQCKGLCQNK
jgi:hypothetical protein